MTQQRPYDAREAFQEMLGKVKLDYIDLYMLHYPFALKVIFGLQLMSLLIVTEYITQSPCNV